MSKYRKWRLPIIGGSALVVMLFLGGIVSSFAFVENGQVGVITHWKAVAANSDIKKPGGPYYLGIGTNMVYISTAQQMLEISSKDIGTVSDKNGVAISFDTTIPYGIDESCATQIVIHGGEDKITKLVTRTAPTAMREAASNLSWNEMQTTKRDALSSTIRSVLARYISEDLIEQGYSKEQASHCVDIYRVQLQSIQPPDSILTALAERASVEIRNESQNLLNQIADKEAARRATEGQGIANVMNNLPARYSPQDVYRVMAAISLKENADAVERAVREDKIKIMVVPGNSPVSFAVP